MFDKASAVPNARSWAGARRLNTVPSAARLRAAASPARVFIQPGLPLVFCVLFLGDLRSNQGAF